MGYGTCSWTCGKCGETYSADGVVGDLKVDRWARDHRDMHRWEEMSTTEKHEHARREAAVMLARVEAYRNDNDTTNNKE